MKHLSIALSILVFSCLSINAQAREFADIYTECGLGAMIAPNNSAVAAVTNVTWDLGTTAISSDASSENSCKGGKEKTASIIYETYPTLETQLAVGNGEHLTAMLQVAGCNTNVHGEVINAIRDDFAGMTAQVDYTTQSRYQKSENLFNAVNSRISRDFAQTCTL